MKSFGVVLIIAYFITGVFGSESFNVLKNRSQNNTSLEAGKEKSLGRQIAIFAICFICFWLSYKGMKEISIKISEETFNTELDYSIATPHYLWVGLNIEGEGQIHIGAKSRAYYEQILDYDASVEDARNSIYDMLKSDWQDNRGKIVPFLVSKIIWAWQDDACPAYFYQKSVMRSPKTKYEMLLFDTITAYSQLFYLIMILGAIVGVGIVLKKLVSGTVYINECVYKNLFFISLIILGYFSITLLSEAQSRYKYLIIPMISIWSVIGFAFVIKKIMESMKGLLKI